MFEIGPERLADCPAITPLGTVLGPEDVRSGYVAGMLTVTVAELEVTTPPAPEQVTEYAVVELGQTGTEPLVAPPVLKLFPEHAFALLEDHEMVEEFPCTIEAGLADVDAVGGGAAHVY